MKVKKTISTPIIAGLIFGALSFLFSTANFTIQISKDMIIGPHEILAILSAALFGPIGSLITLAGMDIGGYFYLVKGVYPAPQDIYFGIGDFIAHSVAMLAVTLGYRFIYKRMKIPLLLAGWVPVTGIYYVMLVLLQVTLYNVAVPNLEASYLSYFSNILPEFISVTVITSLVLLALPTRYRKPQWYELKEATDQISEVQVNRKEGVQ